MKYAIWFIDALDARGGLAFASMRKSDFGEESGTVEAASTLFFSPPEFEPQAVGSRVSAFAAARGALQQGFFIDGTEVAFPNWSAVAEFVRRAYVRSGGGDAPSLGGGGPPQPPLDLEPPGVPDLPPLPKQTEQSPVEQLLSNARKFRDLSEKMSMPREAEPIQITKTDETWSARAVDDAAKARTEVLCRASFRILLELVKIKPLGDSNNSSIAKWLYVVSRFAGALHATKLLVEFDHWFRQSQDARRALRHVLHWRSAYDHIWHEPMNYSRSDPLDDLSVFPIPHRLAKGLALDGEADRHRPSLRNLTFALLGSPLELAEGDAIARERAELLLFAAALIAADGTTHRRSYRHNSYDREWDAIYDRRWGAIESANSCCMGEAWLARSLPQLAFPPPVEKAISKANRLAYVERPGDLIKFARQ